MEYLPAMVVADFSNVVSDVKQPTFAKLMVNVLWIKNVAIRLIILLKGISVSTINDGHHLTKCNLLLFWGGIIILK